MKCFVKALDSYIIAIMLNTLTFTIFVLFKVPIFVEKSSIILKLQLHLSRLITNGYYLT